MKPLLGIDTAGKFKAAGDWSAFVAVDDALKSLECLEANGVQAKKLILPDGWEIDKNGVITPPTIKKDYALVCTDTPGATAISPAVLDYPSIGWFIDVLCWLRIDASITTEKIIYRRKTQSASRLAFGVTADKELFCDIGTTRYIPENIYEGGGRLFNDENIGQCIIVFYFETHIAH